MAARGQTRLSMELEHYRSNKPEWLRSHAREYVLIKNHETFGFFPTFDAAYEAGVAKFGEDTDFLVKRVVEQEPVFVLY